MRILLPEYLLPRREDRPALARRWSIEDNDIVSDNPLYHGGTWVELDIDLRPVDGFRVNFDLVAEHRGISYGVHDTHNMIVYPRYLFALDSAVRLGQEQLRFGVAVGNYENLQLQEGLTMYNLAMQGSRWYLGWRNVQLTFTKIGDLLNGIGLNINDVDDFSLSVNNISISEKLQLDVTASIYNYISFFPTSDDASLSDNGSTLALGLDLDERMRLYAQAALRWVEFGSVPASERLAWLLGFSQTLRADDLEAAAKIEWRSYGHLFNQGYVDHRVMLRSDERSVYANTIGGNLYPLEAYKAPFSQWAVYTEYQDAKSVNAAVAQLTARYRLYDEIFAALNLDLNLVNADGEELFWYPFFEAGFDWRLLPGSGVRLIYSNRAMNLDKHYPTLYLYDGAVLELNAYFDLSLNAD